MIKRYENPAIAKIFSDENKLRFWQDTELAVILARVELDYFPKKEAEDIVYLLQAAPIDLTWWQTRDEEIHHDLNAFIDERLQYLPKNLHQYFHKDMTSYDTEEPAFARMLTEAMKIIEKINENLGETLTKLVHQHRCHLMSARTHGQGAELQSFGARCLTWLMEFMLAVSALKEANKNLSFSKLSGAIGKYGNLNPQLEQRALNFLNLDPFPGATQIMPRILYAPVAQALSNLVSVADKIANDIRLSSRSGLVLMQEPFKKKQKGSSAMPHKKNPIRTEQIEGLARLARAYAGAISENIRTWEERAIEQSCVERVAWPDLFHVTARALTVLDGVLSKLKVYPDNMLEEIIRSRGTIFSNSAKEWLKEKLHPLGIGHEDAYRIIQLASFDLFEVDAERLEIRDHVASSFQEASKNLAKIKKLMREKPESLTSLEEFLPEGKLRVSPDLEIDASQVKKYNLILKELFAKQGILESWRSLFEPTQIEKNEAFLHHMIID